MSIKLWKQGELKAIPLNKTLDLINARLKGDLPYGNE